MPDPPPGTHFAVAIHRDDMIVTLVSDTKRLAAGTYKVIASECEKMVFGGRDYWNTFGPGTAVKLANKIIRRMEIARSLSAELGLKVEVDC